ncbi:hypothetical protein PtA15_8A769 [Puccinia triticina]|nr:uncharacterized protein PtA15_8A769 [Puccinia triticina]WAQ87862.1 hypothetical protein PtA15_8A769 [Puccinia triticina]
MKRILQSNIDLKNPFVQAVELVLFQSLVNIQVTRQLQPSLKTMKFATWRKLLTNLKKTLKYTVKETLCFKNMQLFTAFVVMPKEENK